MSQSLASYLGIPSNELPEKVFSPLASRVRWTILAVIGSRRQADYSAIYNGVNDPKMRDVAKFSSVSDETLKVHLKRLEETEFVARHSSEGREVYTLGPIGQKYYEYGKQKSQQ